MCSASSSDRAAPKAIRDADRIAGLMDTRFRVPGTRLRFGYDSIIGIVPGIGDTATLLIGVMTVLSAVRARAPAALVARMVWNLTVDWLIGLVPVLGFVLDSLYKAHSKKAELLKQWIRSSTSA